MWMISGPVDEETVAYLKDFILAFSWKDWKKPDFENILMMYI